MDDISLASDHTCLVPLVVDEDFSPAFKKSAERVDKRVGMTANNVRAMANSPELGATMRQFLDDVWDHGDLPKPLLGQLHSGVGVRRLRRVGLRGIDRRVWRDGPDAVAGWGFGRSQEIGVPIDHAAYPLGGVTSIGWVPSLEPWQRDRQSPSLPVRAHPRCD